MRNFEQIRSHLLIAGFRLTMQEPYVACVELSLSGGSRHQSIFVSELDGEDQQPILRVSTVIAPTTGIDARRVGVAGHSYGGTTALYHAAVDARCAFACISGAVCSFQTRLREGTGILLFETVPGLAQQLGHHDLLSAIGPRPALVVSGTQDKYSRDADEVVAQVAGDFITELRVERGHALEQERFEAMVEWIVGCAGGGPKA